MWRSSVAERASSGLAQLCVWTQLPAAMSLVAWPIVTPNFITACPGGERHERDFVAAGDGFDGVDRMP